jgi:hypothetical protein
MVIFENMSGILGARRLNVGWQVGRLHQYVNVNATDGVDTRRYCRILRR